MAELIEAVESGHDHDADPLVVEGRYTGLPIDLSTLQPQPRGEPKLLDVSPRLTAGPVRDR